MKSFLFGVVLAAAAVAVALLPASVAADISPLATPVILSCDDGHSVALSADPATLSSLTADVQAINSGGATSCALDTAADPPAAGAKWTVYDYNPSGQEIAPRNSPGSHPATTAGATTSFDFLYGQYTALLTTTDKLLTGDLTGRTLSDTIDLHGRSGTTFETQHNQNCTSNVPATVRFYFVSPAASGATPPPPGQHPAGFYTRFWWSNPVNVQLLTDGETATMTADMSNPAEWSDWNGQSGANPTVTPAFLTAVSHVQEIGLSFGGTCFFETGARAVYSSAPPPYETFSSTFSES